MSAQRRAEHQVHLIGGEAKSIIGVTVALIIIIMIYVFIFLL